MGKTYISDITHFLNDAGELKEMPAPVRRMAEFLTAIVAAVTPKCPTFGHNTGIRCRKRGCKGVVHASLEHVGGKIGWCCLDCEQYGTISGWQDTKWDHTTGSMPAVPRYTPKEGQYLAFIYYYTKLNGQAPSELDMQVYFQVTPPAVHDMVLRLEKHGFISRAPGVPRSIRLLLKREELPDLE
jgi:repressor LexA